MSVTNEWTLKPFYKLSGICASLTSKYPGDLHSAESFLHNSSAYFRWRVMSRLSLLRKSFAIEPDHYPALRQDLVVNFKFLHVFKFAIGHGRLPKSVRAFQPIRSQEQSSCMAHACVYRSMGSSTGTKAPFNVDSCRWWLIVFPQHLKASLQCFESNLGLTYKLLKKEACHLQGVAVHYWFYRTNLRRR